jgi:hypothetical protein
MTGLQRLAGKDLERSGLRPRASAIFHHFLPVGDLVDIAELAVEEGLQVVFALARHPRHKLVDIPVGKKLGRFGLLSQEVGVGMPVEGCCGSSSGDHHLRVFHPPSLRWRTANRIYRGGDAIGPASATDPERSRRCRRCSGSRRPCGGFGEAPSPSNHEGDTPDIPLFSGKDSAVRGKNSPANRGFRVALFSSLPFPASGRKRPQAGES